MAYLSVLSGGLDVGHVGLAVAQRLRGTETHTAQQTHARKVD